MRFKHWCGAIAAATAMAWSGQAAAIPVSLELALLTDVSGSVDSSEYQLQKLGYVNAFRNAAVHDAILASSLGSIAVSYYEWASAASFAIKLNWTLIDSVQAALDFADALEATARSFSGGTNPQAALANAYLLFGTETGGTPNGFESARQVIDVSGDGNGESNANGRNAALAAGVDAINGLVIGSTTSLLTHYSTYIVGGDGAFVMQANTFEDFSDAILDKLVREITEPPPGEVPEPATAALLALGAAGLLATRRRRTARC